MTERRRGVDQRKLLMVVKALLDGERLDRFEVHRRCGVTEQTAHRYLVLVADVLPLATTRQDRRMVYELDRSKLDGAPTFPEALAASIGASLAKVFRGTSYETQLRAIRQRFVQKVGQKQAHFRHIDRKIVVLGNQQTVLGEHREMLDEVVDGVLRQRVLVGKYRRFNGPVESVRLTPYSVAMSGGSLYVIAPENETFHPFRLDRFEEVEATTDVFEYPSEGAYDPESLFGQSMGVFLDLPVADVSVRLSAKWRSYVATHKWHSSQKLVVRADGRIDIHLAVRLCPELERWIMSFGEEAEVVAPASLREKIASRAQNLAKVYEVVPAPTAQ